MNQNPVFLLQKQNDVYSLYVNFVKYIRSNGVLYSNTVMHLTLKE